MDGIAQEEVGMCLAAALVSRGQRLQLQRLLYAVGANFSKNGSGEEGGLLRGQENVLMGGKEIEGNILEGVGNWGEWGCCW